nr:hypothetical protein [Rhodococcus sp. (in: high G+C Gram-positive bacteria)]
MFISTMRFVGDLDDEFYDDERQRDVWNEASAVGFQLFYWVSLIACCILPWVAGVTGSWITLGILIVFVTISAVVVSYARARGLDLYTSQSLLTPRVVTATGLYLIAALSAIATLFVKLADAGSSIFIGMAIGTCVGGGCGVYGILRKRRLNHEGDARAEAAELLELEKEG